MNEKNTGKDTLGNLIAEQIPEITSLDGVIAYKDYLKELGGDFANLDASALGFIDGFLISIDFSDLLL